MFVHVFYIIIISFYFALGSFIFILDYHFVLYLVKCSFFFITIFIHLDWLVVTREIFEQSYFGSDLCSPGLPWEGWGEQYAVKEMAEGLLYSQ